MRPLKPLVGLIGHSDFVSRESTFLQLEERGLKAGYFVLCTIFWARYSAPKSVLEKDFAGVFIQCAHVHMLWLSMILV